jgi:hypothetical protein
MCVNVMQIASGRDLENEFVSMAKSFDVCLDQKTYPVLKSYLSLG